MSAPLAICEKLRALESGGPDFIGDTNPRCVTCWHRNPDGPEAADTIEQLVRKLESAPCLPTTFDQYDRFASYYRDFLRGRDELFAQVRGEHD